MLFAYLLGSIIVFFLIRYVNRKIGDDECFDVLKVTGWSMLIFILASWWGLIGYIVFFVLSMFSVSKYCPNKNSFVVFLRKIDNFVNNVFK